MNVSMGWRTGPDAGVRHAFPPEVVIAIKALACELPYQHGIPVSRLSISEIGQVAVQRGLVASIGESTVWRWLSEDAIRPWCHRSWIFPRDPQFASKASRVLDLYEGKWAGKALGPGDYILSADEKTSIQARRRTHQTLPPAPGRLLRLEHEYTRCGAWSYLAAWDVRQARVFGRCERTSGIAPFDRLVASVMKSDPYSTARRVFWVVDNGSSHRGAACVKRLQSQWPNIVVVHTPIHASWLNQIEVYFSIVQRKVLTPNDFTGLAEVQDRLMRFQEYYQKIAKPFDWRFTRKDLHDLLRKIDKEHPTLARRCA